MFGYVYYGSDSFAVMSFDLVIGGRCICCLVEYVGC